MRSSSLRRRLAVTSLAVLTVALLAVDVFVYVALRTQLDGNLRDRLEVRARLAERLAPSFTPAVLADRLAGDGIADRLTRGGRVVAEGVARAAPPPPPEPPGKGGPPVPPTGKKPKGAPSVLSGGLVELRRDLPGGQRVTLTASRRDVRDALDRLLVLEGIGSAVALALAALVLLRLLGVALRPLDHMTAVALGIARGRTGERLAPERTDTELGRAAVAFDEMLDSLERALAEARGSEEAMRRFLSDASHELRTPLAGLQVTAETLLREDEAPRERREDLTVQAVREARRAGRLVADLLDASRLGDGLPLRTRRVDLAEALRPALERARALAPELRLERAGPSRLEVEGDPDRLGQVIANLLENARHATRGTGRVRVELFSDDGTGQVCVDDDGPGVPEEHQERIFERFARLDEARARDRFGSGLGLAIARAIAEAHGGTLRCGASPLGGARFTLTVPRAVASAPSTLAGAPGPTPAPVWPQARK